MSIKCVIFDMDGTLIDSKKAICKTINHMRACMQMPELDDDFIISIINDPQKNSIKEFYGFDEITTDMRLKFEKEFNKNYELYAVVYKEAMELLEALKEKDYLLGVATNAPHATIENILKNCGILGYFETIVGASKGIAPKPDPAMLNIIRDKFGVECAFIGDSAKDYLAAKNADMHYIHVIWGRDEIISEIQNCKTAKDVIEALH
ncbi:HAD family hydrolase [Campylobacter hyointestinalis]|uniref:HAD family hydrolase n=1 Tax=Campylobacter hyointestinalis TaxID=198 RepID=UPI000CE3CBD4|nr:HAD family hydrolase [Campylobacter hyointestinalis]PPB55878.1 haloacid dehalogenase [Campylobacter hyointestinalis subsp. hyointestinalis]